MAEAIAFDTHRFVKRLTESGFTEKQAETLAEWDEARRGLVTGRAATGMKGECRPFRRQPRTKANIAAVKADIVSVEANTEAVRRKPRKLSRR